MIISGLFSVRLTLSDDMNASLGNRSQLQNQDVRNPDSAIGLGASNDGDGQTNERRP